MTTNTTIPDDIAAVLEDESSYADGRIFDAYRWLRANQPLGIAAPKGYSPFWVVTKHADIQTVSKQNSLFRNGPKRPILTSDLDTQKLAQMPEPPRSLVGMDPPDHGKYRLLTQTWFMPKNLLTMEQRIRDVARATVSKMLASGGRCDFVKDIALGYPLRIIMETFGVPAEDEALMLRLTHQVFGDNEQLQEPGKRAEIMQAAAAEYAQYFGKLTADRRENPRDDLATLIANGQVDGKPLAFPEQLGYYIIIATAGHDTTSSSTAGAVMALCENPDVFAQVRADPSLVPGLVDEAIRWTTPVKHFMRTAAEDTELAGKKIAAGDWLMLCYGSGNRDEDVFEEPDVFRIDRKPNKHISFGYGGHVCLGQHLAKMEMRILFEELIPHLKSLSLDGKPELTRARFVNGPKKLPIKFEIE